MAKKRTDDGPVVFERGPEITPLLQVRHHARHLPPRQRTAYVTDVCRCCADVIALTPRTTWMGHVVTVLQKLDAVTEEHPLTFTRELKRLLPVLAGRVREGHWCKLR